MTSKDWKNFSISDIIEIISGGTPKTSIAEYWNGNIPWLSVKDFNNDNRYVYITEKSISEIGLKNSSTSILCKNDIIISARGTVGELAMIPFDMAFNQSCYGLRAKECIVDNCFLYYLLKYKIKIIQHNTHGSVFDTITKDTFDNIEVLLPPLETQRKIAGILSVLDDKIELNNKINQNLEAQAQAIFKSWFVDFEPFGGTMPDDWEKEKLENLSKDIICGKTPSTKEKSYYGQEVPFITIPDMHNNIYVIKTERLLSNLGAKTQIGKMLPKNSICVSCIATAGLVSLTSTNSQTNQQINSIIPKFKNLTYYLYLTMKNLSEHIIMLGSSGSTTCNLNKGQFAKIDVINPSEDILENFHNIVKTMFYRILNNQIENELLVQLRDTLLPKLMNGDIDVENMEIL